MQERIPFQVIEEVYFFFVSVLDNFETCLLFDITVKG